jgi:rSAM/selenodomain-associated transferase 2
MTELTRFVKNIEGTPAPVRSRPLSGDDGGADAALPVSVIIPTLNAAYGLPRTLACLGWVAEVVIVDGGSTDDTHRIAREAGARLIEAPTGRGVQIKAGLETSIASWVLILHADTMLLPGWRQIAARHMQQTPDRAGYFRFALDSDDPRARRLERMVAWRCRVFALPYGDQGLLAARDTLLAVGGVRPIPLMEDVDLVRRLGRRRLVALDATALTEATRWEREGWYGRSARNLLCLSLFFAGVPPAAIARLYRGGAAGRAQPRCLAN